jgi:hypothetical protein
MPVNGRQSRGGRASFAAEIEGFDDRPRPRSSMAWKLH